jgi:plasmid stability protein
MAVVPTLYLRDVPEALYKGLKRRARRNRRSMNAEAVAILAETLEAERDYDAVIDDLRRLRFVIPEELPPAEAIRRGRDARSPDRPRR